MADTLPLGARLKKWRKSRDLLQADVAKSLGVGQGTISAAESGSLSLKLLLRLVDVYRPSSDEVGAAMREAAGLPSGDEESQQVAS